MHHHRQVENLDFCLKQYWHSLLITYLPCPNLTTSIAARLYLAPAGGLFAFLVIGSPNLTSSIAARLYLAPAGGLYAFPGNNLIFLSK